MNRRVIFTREHELTEDQQRLLQQHNIAFIHAPLIKCVPVQLSDAILKMIEHTEWVFFTSAVSVDFFMPYLKNKPVKFATIGEQTTLALKHYVDKLDFMPKSSYGIDFVQEFSELYPNVGKILFPQSSISNPKIVEYLNEKNYDVTNFIMYDTVSNEIGQKKSFDEILKSDNLYDETVWTFASPSAFKSFYEVIQELPKANKIGVIGTTTRDCLNEYGFSVHLQPSEPSMQLLIEEIIAYFNC